MSAALAFSGSGMTKAEKTLTFRSTNYEALPNYAALLRSLTFKHRPAGPAAAEDDRGHGDGLHLRRVKPGAPDDEHDDRRPRDRAGPRRAPDADDGQDHRVPAE